MADQVESWLAGAGLPPEDRVQLAEDATVVRDLTADDSPDHGGPADLLVRRPGDDLATAQWRADPEGDLELPIFQDLIHPDRLRGMPGMTRLRLVNQVIELRAGVLEVLADFEEEVARTLPEFTGRVRMLRADLERALTGERWCICALPVPEGQAVRACPEHPHEAGVPVPVAEHPWREFNKHGNTCHFPGCDKTEDQHPAAAAAAGGVTA